MQKSVIDNVRRKTTRAKYGEVFFVYSFPLFDEEYVTKLLSQFEKEGDYTYCQRRICEGPQNAFWGSKSFYL